MTCQEILTDEKKLLFALKTKTVKVKTKYSSGYDDMTWHVDCVESHILTCQQNVNENGLRENEWILLNQTLHIVQSYSWWR